MLDQLAKLIGYAQIIWYAPVILFAVTLMVMAYFDPNNRRPPDGKDR